MSETDLSQIPTEQLQAMLQQGQPDLSQVPTDQLMGMLKDHPETPSLLDQVGRQLGLTGRHAIEGTGNLLGIATDPMSRMLGTERTGQMATDLANKLGLPQAQTPLEQGVGAASRALVGTGLTAGGGLLAGAPALAAQPGLQAASSVSGATASDIARQKGAGTAGQIAAGLAGGLSPAAITSAPQMARAVLRAGANPADMQATIAAFEGAGTTPTVGQAGGANTPAAWLESLLSKIPGGYGVIAGKAKQQAEDVGGQLKQMATNLAPNADPAKAGRAIESAIRGEGGFVENFKQTASDLYGKVDALVPAQALLAKLTTPIPGAENVSNVLANPKMQALADALGKDLQGSLGQAGTTGTLPYQALSALRSRVGQQIADAGLVSDTPVAQLKQLYGSLSQDIRGGMQDPAAIAAANRAENYYRAGIDRIDRIEPVIDKAGGPEAIFRAATSGTRDGASTINSVMQSLDPEAQKIVTATVLNKMGQAAPGIAQDGGNFSMQSFLTNWNSLAPAAKSSLFDRMGSGFREDMDSIARTASNLREGNAIYRNTSGTTPAAAQVGTATSIAGALVTGHPLFAGLVAAGVGGANLSARLMTNPTFVRWMANNTNRPVGQLPAQLGYLDNIANEKKDSDLKQFVTLTQQAQQQ
jgi:hypothetical protein